ncbi:ATP synthase F1 subunit gamma [Candidatus Parcubacteria bacterium]|jgi:F-type H+-transporting ATPase subunit gamma|nr:MAG: ATP synthase F1 subunit gamma [Candidatus Parcubacteria bacterium]
MPSTRDIRRRIKSIGNTRKITKAMELVAASKMRKAVAQALATRAYALAAWEVLTNVSRVTNREAHALLIQRPIKKVAVIVISSDRGLAGGFNANIVRQALQVIAEENKVPVEVIALGNKGADGLRRAGVNLVAAFSNPHTKPTLEDLAPLTKIAIADFVAGIYDKVYAVYTDFVSTLTQKARSRVVLPIQKETVRRILDDVAPEIDQTQTQEINPYLFEPSGDEVLEKMLKALVQSQVYQVVLESLASEHAARMVAMRNANDAAGELIDDLTLTYNQARQAGITREIAEISAGRAALE